MPPNPAEIPPDQIPPDQNPLDEKPLHSALDIASARANLPDDSPAHHEVKKTRWHLWILLLITLLGATLRFSHRDKPNLWGDDAYTIYRTHADFQSMLDILQDDGFTPLHYELHWALGRTSLVEAAPSSTGKKQWVSQALKPETVRLLPAFFGSLMVPAMYFLASQLVRRRTALVCALFAACSAYLLGYSRDGKMYMMQWSFSCLSVGCMLWWCRVNTRIAFLAWVASTLAACSSHMTGLAILPLELIFFITRGSAHWKQAILFVVGIAIAGAGPLAYTFQFNRWAQAEMEDLGFEVEGLGWVVEYNKGRTGFELLRYAGTAYLFSWEWPNDGDGYRENQESTIQPWILSGLKGTAVILSLLMIAGIMPWGRRLRGIKPDETPPQPWWRTSFWISAWLIIPLYFLYCRSMQDFVSPAYWWQQSAATLAGPNWTRNGAVSGWFWFWIAAAASITTLAVFIWPRFRRGMVWFFPLLAGLALIIALLRMGLPPIKSDLNTTIVRAFAPINTWVDWITDPLVLAGALVILPGLLIYFCGNGALDRTKRIIQCALVAVVMIGVAWAVYHLADIKYQKEIKQALERSPSASIDSIKTQLARPSAAWQSIFMPRYVGFVWIAFCIAAVTLLMRLPTRPLRIIAVTILISINLAQFSGRIFAGTEPRLDWVARDIWKHDSHNPSADPTGKVYVNDVGGGAGHPANGTLSGQQGKYYLGVARGYWVHPFEWKLGWERLFDITSGGRRGQIDFYTVAQDAKRRPSLKTLIIWEKYPGMKPPAADPLLPLLGPEWSLARVDDQMVRFHWTWAEKYLYRRTEYVKRAAVAAQ